MSNAHHTRAELPANEGMDEHRQMIREAFIEYLQGKMGREERKDIIKEALKEIWWDCIKDFGWFSVKTIATAAMISILWIWAKVKGVL